MFVSNNSVLTLQKYFLNSLRELYEEREAHSIMVIVFEKLKGWNRVELRLNEKENLSESELLEFNAVLKRLIKGEPVQYVLGETEFYGLPFLVEDSVLIPRQETEELVSLVLERVQSKEVILDIGTGSGCIAIALKANLPNVTVRGVDISPKALEVAAVNAETNNVIVEFELLDVLQKDAFIEGFSAVTTIVSNPPYVLESDRNKMHTNVLQYEPDIALFVPDKDPLLFYREIIRQSDTNLPDLKNLYFEVHENYAEEVKQLLLDKDFSMVKIVKDINNKARFVYAKK